MAKNQITLYGKVFNEHASPIHNAKIVVGEITTFSSKLGEFKITVPKQAIYSLDISAKEFYEMRFSYSLFELNASNTKSVKLDDFFLVEKKAGRVLMAFGGDVMMGRRYAKPYFNNPALIKEQTVEEDTKEIVQYMAPYLKKADFAAVNLETQIADKTPVQRAPKSVTFYSPPETVNALKIAGVDYVTLGNNHTYDYLDSGLKSTIETLKKYNLPYSGAGQNDQEALKAHRTLINGNAFGMLGFVGWEGSANPSQTADSHKGGAAYGSLKNIVASVKREVADNRITVAQYHGSLEYEDEPTMMTETRLKAAIDAGADLAIAHHPHVTQGFEVYNGKLIAYSMGNFIFDQFFYATNHSFLLYVWMDGEEFYRAEVVPVYLQGYVPTPATGEHRSRILARLNDLTSKRNTHFSRNAGHGVILPNKVQADFDHVSLFSNGKYITPLPKNAFEGQIRKLTSSSSNRYRLGVNLINNSDFETHTAFYSHDRGFNLDQSDFYITNENAFSGEFSLKRDSKDANSTLAMTNFTRVYRAGNPASVSAMIKGKGKVNIYWQGRKTRDKMFDALKNGNKHLIESVVLTGNWQEIVSEFNTPRVGYRSIRILLEFESTDEIYIDDLALIEWRTPWLNWLQQANFHNGAGQSTFIGFETPLISNVELMLE
ncbi:CapA family protein [Pseudoalteromonas sp. SSM20]|uniref:CapA family protein n=1 Tax=Pseudoalteromonas sp. SSM20 TaxID=3139394 RepID=UPI003BAA494C